MGTVHALAVDAGRPGLLCDVVTDADALMRLEGDWKRLLAITPLASGFQSLPWIAACRAALPEAGARLFVPVVRDGEEILGILPAEIGPGGRLRLIGDAVSNYGGPLYRPDRLEDVLAGFARCLDADRRVVLLDLHGLRDGSPFLAALRRCALPGWRGSRIVQTSTCPIVDLSAGWESVYARRRGRQRSNDARKWRALARLDDLEFVEIVEPEAVRAALPAMFRLFRERWAGRRESSGFARHRRGFHERAASALATAGHVRLALLELGGEIVAFSYGVRLGRVTTSYVLAHDDRFGVCSPGLLLLVRVLEAAARRGDPEYDFSIGEEAYKDAWATGTRAVFRALHWREGSRAGVAGRVYALGSRTWAAARSIVWLRDVRRRGFWRSGGRARSDWPGMAAGPGPVGTGSMIRSATVADMTRHLSPELFRVAVDRCFRGDTLLLVSVNERTIGLVWRAGEHRPGTVEPDAGSTAGLYYHPIPVPGHAVADLARVLAEVTEAGEAAIVVAKERLTGDGVQHAGVLGAAGTPATRAWRDSGAQPTANPVPHGTLDAVLPDSRRLGSWLARALQRVRGG
jgi:CelD/BcsL family acetyltransferase involved in cellulose biosynthesis